MDTINKENANSAKSLNSKEKFWVPPNNIPVRTRLDPTRDSITHKFDIGGQEGYITVGLYNDGSPGEVFVKMSKQGSTLDGMVDSFAILLSLSLQSGMSLSDLVEKFRHTKFPPYGATGNEEIPKTSSIVDYIFRWLELEFLI